WGRAVDGVSHDRGRLPADERNEFAAARGHRPVGNGHHEYALERRDVEAVDEVGADVVGLAVLLEDAVLDEAVNRIEHIAQESGGPLVVAGIVCGQPYLNQS